MFGPLLLVVVGQVSPAPPLNAGPVVPLQPVVVEPFGGLAPATAGTIVGPPRVDRSVLVAPAAVSVVEPDLPLTATDHAPIKSSVAARILRDALRQVESSRSTPSDDMSLLAALDASTSSTHRREIVSAYWRLAAAAARCGWAMEDERRWSQIAAPTSEFERIRWEARRAAASARERQARLDLSRAQHRIAELTGRSDDAAPLLPADIPFVGRYDTRIDALVGANASRDLRGIHRQLPEERDLIERWGAAAEACRAASEVAARIEQAGQLPIGESLVAQSELIESRERMLEVVLSYNEQIARYAFAFADDATPATTLVGMLIPIEPSAARSTSPRSLIGGGVRQASAIEPIRSGGRSSGDLPAFREIP